MAERRVHVLLHGQQVLGTPSVARGEQRANLLRAVRRREAAIDGVAGCVTGVAMTPKAFAKPKSASFGTRGPLPSRPSVSRTFSWFDVTMRRRPRGGLQIGRAH